LLTLWLRDPSQAPGRFVSSPWPDRIEIVSLAQEAPDRFRVTGFIVEVTSMELVSGGAANKVPVVLTIQKEQGRWLITEFAQEVAPFPESEADSIMPTPQETGPSLFPTPSDTITAGKELLQPASIEALIEESCKSVQILEIGSQSAQDLLVQLGDEIISSQSIVLQPGVAFALVPEGNPLSKGEYILFQTSFTAYLEPAIIVMRKTDSERLDEWHIAWAGQAETEQIIRHEIGDQYPEVPRNLIDCLDISPIFLQD